MNCRRSAVGDSSCWLELSDRSVLTLSGLSVRGAGDTRCCSSRVILCNRRLERCSYNLGNEQRAGFAGEVEVKYSAVY